MKIPAELHKLLDEAAQGMVPPDLKALGWRYQDFPGTFSPEMWKKMLALIGEGEYKIVAMSSGVRKGVPFARGQLFISPQGYVNMKDKERQALILYEPKGAA